MKTVRIGIVCGLGGACWYFGRPSVQLVSNPDRFFDRRAYFLPHSRSA